MFIKGYKYITEFDAAAAKQDCNDYYGIPISVDSITQNWCEYNQSEELTPTFWYIIFHESLLPILGDPTNFEI